MWVQTVKSGVEMFAYAPDGRRLYVADSAGRVSEWDTAARTGRDLFVLNHPSQWGLFCAAGGRFLVARTFRPVVWDCRDRREHAVLDINDGTMNPIGSYVLRPVPGDDTLLYVNHGRGLGMRVWDVARRAYGPSPAWWPRVDPLSWFDVSPDGRTVALVDSTHVRLADLLTGEWVAQVRLLESGTRAYFSPDGQVLALLVQREVWFWNPATGLAHVEGAITSVAPNFSVLKAFAFHPTAPLFVALTPDGLPAVFDRHTHRVQRTFDFRVGKRVNCACFSPDGLTCAIGGSNKRFAVFDVDL
ncbi:MAG: WD40 repeat domain-containing protein [Planctomycetes bacterium]|nr:WD40 repeat domain-containing protein [Planctomycetota bacterium]